MSKTTKIKAVEQTTEVKETSKKPRKAKKTAAAETAEVKEVINETQPAETPTESTEKTASAAVASAKVARVRGKKYQEARKKIDINKYYPLSEAIKLVKETSFSKFPGKIEAHITTFDIGNVGEISFPHLETVAKKVVILNDAILADLKNGTVNFDILIATPATMPKLLPFARVLGPKGLMPNPKSGTLTDKPEEAVKKLSAAKTMIKTEKKSPVIHVVVGKVSQAEKELEANVEELIKVVKAPKIKKLALCATMGPSVKVEIVK